MKKRILNIKSQVTIFIILAVMLVAAGGIAFLITQNGSDTGTDSEFFSQADIKQGVDQIQSSVLDCQRTMGNDALDTIGIQGGYYNAPKEAFDLGWAFIPYYYNEGEFLMPEKSKIENELSSYIDENFNLCLETIDVKDFSLSYLNPKTKTTIKDGVVSFTIDLPITIKKEDKTTRFELKDNPVSINSKLYGMIEIAKFITDSHKEDPDMVCVSCVSDMARQRSLYVDFMDFTGDGATTLVVISTNATETYPMTLEFLNKYNLKSSISSTTTPSL